MSNLTGKWLYRSFRNDAITVAPGTPPTLSAPPLAGLIIPWAPASELNITDNNDVLSGTIHVVRNPAIGGSVAGTYYPAATPGDPDSFELTVTINIPGQPEPSIYFQKGLIFPGVTTIIGTVIALQHDVAKQPDGTPGQFLLTQ